MQVGLAAIELDDPVIPAPVVRNGVERLVDVRHEMHSPLEGFPAESPILGLILKQSE